MNGETSWDQFQLMISRSTTPDLIKIVTKLDEFFEQQLSSGKRALAVMAPISSTRTRRKRVDISPSATSNTECKLLVTGLCRSEGIC